MQYVWGKKKVVELGGCGIAKAWWKEEHGGDHLKIEFQKACNVALDDGLDLKQVSQDQDLGFFIHSGVKRGVAWRFHVFGGNWKVPMKELGKMPGKLGIEVRAQKVFVCKKTRHRFCMPLYSSEH